MTDIVQSVQSGLVPLLDEQTGRFPDEFAPPSVAADATAAQDAAEAAGRAQEAAEAAENNAAEHEREAGQIVEDATATIPGLISEQVTAQIDPKVAAATQAKGDAETARDIAVSSEAVASAAAERAEADAGRAEQAAQEATAPAQEMVARALDAVSSGAPLYPSLPLVARGDSTTAQTSNPVPATRAFTRLAATLGVDLTNRGQSGARSDEIAHLAGAIPATCIVEGSQIPSSGHAGLLELSPDIVRAGEIASYPAIISGIRGTVSRSGSERWFTPDVYPDSPVTVANRVLLTSLDNLAWRSSYLILGMGSNDLPLIESGQRTVADVCEWFARTVDSFAPLVHRMLIWGPLDRGASEGADTARGGWIRQIEEFLSSSWPGLYVPLRQTLSADGIARAGITPTAQDLADIAAGAVPQSLRDAGSVHLNAAGMRIQADEFDAFFREKAWFPAHPRTQFDPTARTDILAWYDPRQEPIGLVASVADRSGSARTLSAAGAPAVVGRGLGGTRSFVFDGSSSLRTEVFTPLGAAPVTIAINCQDNALGATAYFCDGNGANDCMLASSGSGTVVSRRNATTTPLTAIGRDALPHSWVVALDPAGTSTLYRDGVVVATGSLGGIPPAPSLSRITLGANGSGSAGFLTGLVGDYLLMDGAIDQPDALAVSDWLMQRRGS